MPQDQRSDPLQEASRNFNVIIGLAQSVSKLADVFMRVPGTWGTRYCTLHMVLSWLLCLAWPVLSPHEDPWPMHCVFLLATVGLLIHRMAGVWRQAHGYRCHSRYGGTSWLSLFSNDDELRVKAFGEPVLLFLLGLLLGDRFASLGAYLWTVAFCGLVAGLWQLQAHQARIQAVLDAEVEARWLNYEIQKQRGKK